MRHEKLKAEVCVQDFDDTLFVVYNFLDAQKEVLYTKNGDGTPAEPAEVELTKVSFTPLGDDASNILQASTLREIEDQLLERGLPEKEERE